MKALEKERTRGYESASGVARDIRRHLDGETVEATPPSTTYRLRKLAHRHRHRAALVTAAAFATLLIASTILATGLAIWASRGRVRAHEDEVTTIEAFRQFSKAVRDTEEL